MDAAIQKSVAPAAASDPGSVPHKARVLAVDDQRDSLRLLELRLLSAGMECFGFSDPETALAFLANNTVDIIMLDLMMPELDGYEVCHRLKQDPRLRDIPVLFLTAKDSMEDKVRALQAGGHDYLTKPVEQAELLARTNAALRVKHLQDQLREQLQLQDRVNKLHQEMLNEHWQKTFGQLAASLAHEINNPLAAAIGTIQLLTMDETLETDVASRLNLVDRSLQRASQKLRSLLLIAQTSRVAVPISLGQLLDDLLTIINYQVVMAKVNLHTEFQAACQERKVSSDLARAVLYVFNNAIEAVSGQAGAQLTVRLIASDRGHAISIMDNGPGIPRENLEKVQQPFFTTKSAPHHGVGLYLATTIVEACGGKLEVKSPAANGRGTEAIIYAPEFPEPLASRRLNETASA